MAGAGEIFVRIVYVARLMPKLAHQVYASKSTRYMIPSTRDRGGNILFHVHVDLRRKGIFHTRDAK
ncbi:hypothetical protein B0F90DRAFT_1698186 [Multifurca ochricompacta]|uniref:Uncharacterized protein n=1 Tax=Multifurca ochricompacta TaxID=376703 RepID=A0AAD4M7V6_9AGAM|nr:hypothetical protein B0F90DRAFT_1698186 [Multifurca ochricompacta]